MLLSYKNMLLSLVVQKLCVEKKWVTSCLSIEFLRKNYRFDRADLTDQSDRFNLQK